MKEYISWFNSLVPNGYNITDIINERDRLSKETKEKMSIAAKTPKRLKIASKNGKSGQGKGSGKSKYCGVVLDRNKYLSRIVLDYNTIHLGSYNLESDAAKAYDIAAIKYFGKEAKLNFPDLKKEYINNKIIVKRNSHGKPSKTGEKGISLLKSGKFRFRWTDKYSNKIISKIFVSIEEIKQFKLNNLLED